MKYRLIKIEKCGKLSHPSRGGWIEISHAILSAAYCRVPPLAGWVD